MIDRPSSITDRDADEPEEDLVALLRRYDEELRRGALAVSTAGDAISADTPADMDNVLNCLHLLERAWPRTGPELAATHPERIGRFRIDRTLGQGGFGIVYLATDPELRRQVALKVPRLHALAQPQLLERFRREARTAAGLDHPNIIPVHEAGEAGGVCYIASTYCSGPTLAQWLRDQPGGVAARTAATLVEQLADAVAYSHSRGVLHRDIKPGNVLLDVGRTCESGRSSDQFVGKESDGLGKPSYDKESDGLGNPSYEGFTPRLGDFGLAKVAQDALADGTLDVGPETGASALLGTPSYMAPEQVGRSNDVGPATDVYALGAVLYELLTGRPPFQGPNVADVLDQVRHTEPVPVRRLRRDVPRDLETICLACLEKEPGRRYAGAAELRDDLKRFLAGEAIRARPPGWVGRTVKWVKRRPAAAGMVAVGVAAVVGIVVQQRWHAAKVEQTNRELETALEDANQIRYASDIQAAWRARTEGDFAEFEAIFNRYRDGEPQCEYRGLEWYYLERFIRSQGRELVQLRHPVYAAVFVPTRAALLVAGQDGRARDYRFLTGTLNWEWDTHQSEVNAIAISSDSRRAWTTGDDGTIREWDLRKRRETLRINAHTPSMAFDLVYDPVGERLISCGAERAIRIWDASTGASLGTLDGHLGTVEDLELHPDGRRLVSASQDGKVHVWDVQDQRLLSTLNPRSGKMRSVAISRSGSLVVTCSDVAQVWDLESGKVLATIPFLDPPQRVCFPFRNDRICVADESGMLHMFLPVHDAKGLVTDYQPGPSWRAHTGRPFVLSSSGNGSFVAGGEDGRVTVWNSSALSSTELKAFSGPSPVSLAFDRTRGRLLIGGDSGLCVWEYEAPKPTSFNLNTSAHWKRVAVSRDTNLYAAGDNDGNVEIWDAPSLSRRSRARVAPGCSICALDFACDGRALLVATSEAGSESDAVVVLDPDAGKVVQRFDVGHASVAAFSPTEPEILVLSALPHTIRLFHWPTATMLWESAEMPQRPVSEALAFTPDGQRIVTGSGDRIVRVWDRQTGALIRELRGHRADIGHIGVSPDGRTIASIDDDGLLKLWHNATGQFLFEMLSHREQAPELFEFSPDGRWLAIAAGVNTVELFPLRQ